VCNLYSITTNQEAIIRLFRKVNRYVGNLAPMPGVFPDYPAPVIRNAGAERELIMMRWGMPPPPKLGGPPVTNIRNTSSPHWRGWLKPENRCRRWRQQSDPDLMGGVALAADSGHRAGIRRSGRHIEEVILRRTMFQGRHLTSHQVCTRPSRSSATRSIDNSVFRACSAQVSCGATFQLSSMAPVLQSGRSREWGMSGTSIRRISRRCLATPSKTRNCWIC
jgi:hypothetical protein